MIIGIDKGHSVSGAATGAAGLLVEHVENRKIGNELISLLRSMGHTVVDCSVDQASDVNSQLGGIVRKANAQKLDLFVSIHLNAGGGNGTETYVYNGSYSGKQANKDKAIAINNAVVSSCNFRNRGVKEDNFYVLRETVAPAVLVEVCFVDSSEDKEKLNCSEVAKAMAKAITGQNIVSQPSPSPSTPVTPVTSNGDNELRRYSENGRCTVTTSDGILFRDKPNVYTGKIIDSYEYQESVYYDLVVITEKYVWISWIGASSGTRRYMPITDRSNNEKWAYCE